MFDNSSDDDEKESLKLKIRKILLLKTDDELKKNMKKSNIMINSKTIQEINKKYNVYNILLSEKSKVYFNFVKTGEKIYPNNKTTRNQINFTLGNIKSDKPIKLMPNAFEEESYSPSLCFLPKKVEIGVKNPFMPKTNSLKIRELTEENYDQDNKALNESNKINKSTRIERKGLFKLVDKIVNIKMNEDNEDLVKKNILKLRKYCKTLKNIIRKKADNNNTKKIKDKKEKNGKKRISMPNNKNFFKKSLFGSVDKNFDENIGRGEHRGNTTKNANTKNIEKHNQREKEKEKEKEKDKKAEIIRLGSSKAVKQINSIKKDKIIENPNKKRIRRMKTLKETFKTKYIEKKLKNIKLSKKSEINKNDESYHNNSKAKGHLLSSKFQRPNIFLIYNNMNNANINNNNNKAQQKAKVISLFNNKNSSNNKDIKRGYVQTCFNKEKDIKLRLSNKKNKKNNDKLYTKTFHLSKKEDNLQLIKFEEKNNINEGDINLNFLSDYNRKTKKKSK
jgi:hypothetical protein